MNHKFLRYLSLTILLFFCSSCGGGVSGTGGSQSQIYQGIITDSSGVGIANLSVTIAETGDDGVTDSTGMFSISSESGLSNITLILENDSINQTVPIQIDEIKDSISIAVSVDTKNQSSDAFGVDIRVKIVGICDRFFENTRPIRQANAVRKGQECTIRVSMRSRKGGLQNRQYALQVSDCKSNKEHWNQILVGKTSDIGIGFSKFKFEDSVNKCIYRVLVPLNDNKIPVLEFPIHTFSYQKLKKVG